MIPAVPSTATRSGLHNDVQHGIDQRHPVRQLAADAAATRGGGHRGAHSARHALGARHARSGPRVHACSSVEAAARTTHATRSAHDMCVMVGVHLAASTQPRHAGRRRAGRRRWIFEYWSLRGFVLEHNRFPGTKWSRGCLEIAFVESWCV